MFSFSNDIRSIFLFTVSFTWLESNGVQCTGECYERIVSKVLITIPEYRKDVHHTSFRYRGGKE